MTDEIQARKQSLIDTYENGYKISKIKKEIGDMKLYLIKLMELKAVKSTDKRLKILGEEPMKNKRDARDGIDYNCIWLQGRLPQPFSITATIPKRTLQRVEGKYEGTVEAESREVELMVYEVTKLGVIKRFAEKHDRLFKDRGIDIYDKIDTGECCLLGVRTMQGCVLSKNDFGYILISRQGRNGTIKCLIVLDKQNISQCNMNYENIVGKLSKKLTNLLGEINHAKVEIRDY